MITKIFFDDKNHVIISPKTIYFDLPKEFTKSLEHEIKSMITRNESLTEYTTKNEISQLLLKYLDRNDSHEHEKQ